MVSHLVSEYFVEHVGSVGEPTSIDTLNGNLRRWDRYETHRWAPQSMIFSGKCAFTTVLQFVSHSVGLGFFHVHCVLFVIADAIN